MRLNSSLDTLETQPSVPEANHDKRRDEGLPDSPESPDEGLCSDVFIVEEEPSNHEESITSSRVLEYLEQVRQEDSTSYFETPPGTSKKMIFLHASPVNDLEEPREPDVTTAPRTESSSMTLLPRLPGRGVFPRGVALSQPAPGLGCCCSLRFPRWYFGY